MASLWSVCGVVCLLTVVSRVTGESVVVNTRYGALRGTRTPMGPYPDVDAFYNIPYAKPPVGDLRFSKPVPSGAWNGTRDATTPGSICPQRVFNWNTRIIGNYTGSEDCLYLNVYKPETATGEQYYPVMVWIHGGGYNFGGGNLYNASQLAARGVVVVTINYRLGAFGFLSTEDTTIAGNYGMHDMVLALKWVRDVIHDFNGSPDEVTVFGHTSGSSAISLLIQTQEAKGLFNQAIMESGVSLTPWAISLPQTQPRPRDLASMLAAALGCPSTDSSLMLACLRARDPQTVVETSSHIPDGILAHQRSIRDTPHQSGPSEENDSLIDASKPKHDPYVPARSSIFIGTYPTPLRIAPANIPFPPVMDSAFLAQDAMLQETPETALQNGLFGNVTVIRGFNKDEGAFGVDALDPEDDGFTLEEFVNYTRNTVDHDVKPKYNLDAALLVELLVQTYVTTPNVTDPIGLRTAYIELMTDFNFRAAIYKETQLSFQAQHTTEFMYRFSYRATNRLSRPWQGVTHGDDPHFVFGMPFDSQLDQSEFVSNWTHLDRQVSSEVMTLWTNFAKYGDPTKFDTTSPKWLPWTPAATYCIDIGATRGIIFTQDTPGIRLWNVDIPRLVQAAGDVIVG